MKMSQQLFNHVRSVAYTVGGAQIVNVATTQNGDAEQDIDAEIAVSTTNQLEPFAITKANLLAVMIYADGPLQIKTNSTSAPQDSIILTAGQEIAWMAGDAAAAPFSSNVTAIYVTNSSTSIAVNLKIRSLSSQ